MNAIDIYVRSEFTSVPRWESSFKLIYLLRGELSFHAGLMDRHLGTHDFTFIRPFEIYGQSIGSSDAKVLIVDIHQEFWQSVCPNADKLHFSLSVLTSGDNRSTYSSICSSLSQIVYYSRKTGENCSARICRAVSEIIAILVEDLAEAGRSDRQDDQTSFRVQNILQYIIDNYTRRISLEEISDAIGFHPQYFSAYFKRNFGIGFTDYLNRYRVEKSAVMLKESGESILSIALSCGFNNHKTYSNAFEKIYGCSPGEYRKSQTGKDKNGLPESDDDFDHLRQFWNPRELRIGSYDGSHSKCSIILGNIKPSFINRSHNMVSIGRAISCLRSDMHAQLKAAKEEMDLEYVRIRDIFSDDLFVYYEDKQKTPILSWRALDEILDFLVSIDVKPFIELGYMPGQLAARKQYAGWQYHPNVSAPKSYKLWGFLVESFISHLISRYGKETVENWLFDFWTSPNLDMESGYWNDTQDDFFRFYEYTWHSIKNADSHIRFGSSNFSYPSGMKWYEDFLDFAAARHVIPDFMTIHLYASDDGLDDAKEESFLQYSVFDNNYSIPRIRPRLETITTALDELKKIMKDKGVSDLPVTINDWNVTFFPTDFTRDTCFMGPYIINTYFESCARIFGMGFASLSDIHEDFFNTDQLFNGGPGLLSYNGIRKASYHALRMVYRFSRNIIQKGRNYVVGKTDLGFEILIYNLAFYNNDYEGNDPTMISFTKRYNVFEQTPVTDFHIEIKAETGDYNITRSLVSRSSGSAYDMWIKMGSPVDLTPEMALYLSRTSTPEMHFETLTVNDAIILDEVIEPHSFMHIEISKL